MLVPFNFPKCMFCTGPGTLRRPATHGHAGSKQQRKQVQTVEEIVPQQSSTVESTVHCSEKQRKMPNSARRAVSGFRGLGRWECGRFAISIWNSAKIERKKKSEGAACPCRPSSPSLFTAGKSLTIKLKLVVICDNNGYSKRESYSCRAVRLQQINAQGDDNRSNHCWKEGRVARCCVDVSC